MPNDQDKAREKIQENASEIGDKELSAAARMACNPSFKRIVENHLTSKMDVVDAPDVANIACDVYQKNLE